MLKMIVYIISQKPGKYKTNFIKPSQRKTDILYREFAAKSHFILEMLADLLNSGCKKSSSLFQDELFCTRSEDTACAVRGTVSCEGEQPEEEAPDTRYLFKNKKKKIS